MKTSTFTLLLPALALLALTPGFTASAQTATADLIHAFSGTDGSEPEAAPIVGNDGNLYGTTAFGSGNNGTVYMVSPDGTTFTVLHTFTDTGGDGGGPDGVLIQANDNKFYGTALGGTGGGGTIYQLSADGQTYTTLLEINYPGDGGDPLAGLTQASDGNFYGTTFDGSTGDQGTVFRVSPDGQMLTTLASLGNFGSGGSLSGLLQGSDGNFYGTTSDGGTYGHGTVFRVSPDGGTFTTLHSFTGTNGEGVIPAAGLIQGSDGSFYGTTAGGGPSAAGGEYGDGTIFKLSADGRTFTTVHAFTDAEGGGSDASLLLGRDGNIYGTGLNIGTDGNGPVFRLSADGKTLTVLPGGGYGSDGALIQASDGNFYGTTKTDFGGGGNTIFELSADGRTYTTLHTFTNTQGEGTRPETGLLQGSDGNLYGTTYYGGTNNNGAVFRLDVTLPDVVQFHAAINSVNETAGTASVRVDRIGGSGALAVAYQTADGTAVALTDYTPATGELIWQAGDQTPKFITVTIANRGFTDGSLRTLSLTLSNPVDLSETTTLGFPATATLTINGSIPGAPVITSAATATGTTGQAFSYQIAASASPTHYGVTGLPMGLSVGRKTGTITGTPQVPGTFTLTLNAYNKAGQGSQTLTLTVADGPPDITSASTASYAIGTAFSYQITADHHPTAFGVTGLPPGLSVNAQTGAITGTPTTAGTDSLTLNAYNAAGKGSQTLTLVQTPPTVTSAATAQAAQGTAFSYQITASGNATLFGVYGLPDGITVNAQTGVVSGQSKFAGTFAMTLNVYNSGGKGSQSFTLTVAASLPVVTSATTDSATVGTAYSYQITATNQPTAFGVTGLPPGLSVNASTGLITGTPKAAGIYTLTLNAYNPAGKGSGTLTLTVGS